MAKLRTFFAGKVMAIPVVLVVTALPVLAGYLKIANTYDGFMGEVFSCAWTYLYLLALVIVTWALVGVLALVVAPKRWGALAIVVGLVACVLIVNPLAIAPLKGAEAPGQRERDRLVNLPGPLEQLLTDELDDQVRSAQASETAVFVEEYVGRGKRGKADLVRRLDRSLAGTEDVSRVLRARLNSQAEEILATRNVRFDTRLKRIARVLYDNGLRDTVTELAR